jgi:hypothetical protein
MKCEKEATHPAAGSGPATSLVSNHVRKARLRRCAQQALA